MKKTYTTPVLIVSGDIVEETLRGAVPQPEILNQDVNMGTSAGSVGYYL